MWLAELLAHQPRIRRRNSLRRRPAEPSVNKPIKPVLLVTVPIAPELPLRHPKKLARLQHRQIAALPAAQYIPKLLHPAVLYAFGLLNLTPSPFSPMGRNSIPPLTRAFSTAVIVLTRVSTLPVSNRATAFSETMALCESAWGPDADRHAKLLIIIRLEGSNFGAYSHGAVREPPRAMWATGGLRRQVPADAAASQLGEASASSLPLLPGDGAQPPPDPFIECAQHRRGLTETEVAAPTDQVWEGVQEADAAQELPGAYPMTG